MALFRKKTDNSVLPEVEQYYEGERRERTGLAWLLALFSVAIVALVLVGVFLAGRWAYRQVANNDDNEEVGVVSTEDSELSVDGGSTDGKTDKSKDKANKDKNGQQSDDQPTDVSGTTGGSSNDSGSDSSSDDEAETVPVTGSSELPSTGPAETLALFAGASTLSGIGHNLVSRRKRK